MRYKNGMMTDKNFITVIPKDQVAYTGFEDNPLCEGVKLTHKGA
jgi:hypothetical protein